jgi:hypothetical protein
VNIRPSHLHTCALVFALAVIPEAHAQCVQSIAVPEFAQSRTVDGDVSQVLTVDPDGTGGPLPQKLIVLGDFAAAAGLGGFFGSALFDEEVAPFWFPLPPVTSTGIITYHNINLRAIITSIAPMSSGGENIGYVGEYNYTLNRWVALGNFNAPVESVAPLGEGLFFTGAFTLVDNQPLSRYAAYVDGQWSAPPLFQGEIASDIVGLAPNNYATYTYDSSIDGYAVWLTNGTQTWTPAPSCPSNNGNFTSVNGQLALIWRGVLGGSRLQSSCVLTDSWTCTQTTWPDAFTTGDFTITRDGSRHIVQRTTPSLSTVLTFDTFYVSPSQSATAYRDDLVIFGPYSYINNQAVGPISLLNSQGTLTPLRSYAGYPGTIGRFVRNADRTSSTQPENVRVVTLESPLINDGPVSRDSLLEYTGTSEWRQAGSFTGSADYPDSSLGFISGNNTHVIRWGSSPTDAQRPVLVRFPDLATTTFPATVDGYLPLQAIHSESQTYVSLFDAGSGTETRFFRVVQGTQDAIVPALLPLPGKAAIAVEASMGTSSIYAAYPTGSSLNLARWTGSSWLTLVSLPSLDDVQLIQWQSTLYLSGRQTTGNLSRLLLYSFAGGSTPVLVASSEPFSPFGFFYKLEATRNSLYITSPGLTFADVTLGRIGRYTLGAWQSVDTPLLSPTAPIDLLPYDDGILIHGDFTSLIDGTPAFKFAYIPDPLICVADQNCDGGVDGADIEAFFITFAAGSPAADVNNDGGVDGSDVEAFYRVWTSGDPGCR